MMEENNNSQAPQSNQPIQEINQTLPQVKPYDFSSPATVDIPKKSTYSANKKALFWITFGPPAVVLLLTFPWTHTDDMGMWGLLVLANLFFWILPILFLMFLFWIVHKIKGES